MNIAFLAGSVCRSGGGIYTTMLSLAKTLVTSGQQLWVLGAGEIGSAQRLWEPVEVRVLSTFGPARFGFMPGLTSALKELSIDLVHTHGLWMHPSIVATRWGNRHSKPRIVSVHGMLNDFALRTSSLNKKIALPLYEIQHLQSADCLHALCDAELLAIRNFGLRNPVCVIPNGVDIIETAAEPERPAWMQSLPPGTKVLLFLGRLHRIKGLRNLLLGWHVRRSDGGENNWILAIAGWDDDNYQRELEQLIDERNLQDNVFIIGPQFDSEKLASLRHSDAFILPSHSEGFPVTVLEAWAHGLPVLMTNECNIPDGFDAGAAIEIKPTSSGVASGLQKLFSMKKEERESMGRNGRLLVGTKFTWPIVASEMLDVYRWVSDSGDRPNCVNIA